VYRISRNVPRTFPALDRIVARLSQHLAQRPDAAWARFYRGMALLRRGRLEAALEDMEQSVDRVGHLSGTYFELGRAYLSRYLVELESAHRHLVAEGRRGHLRRAQPWLQQAALTLGEAVRLDGEQPGWQEHFAEAVERLAREDAAGCVAVCDDILALDPDAEEVWKLRGDAQRQVGEAPFESYDRALEVRRGYHEVCLAQASAWLERGECGRARAALERALEIHPELHAARVQLARLLLEEARAGDRTALADGLAAAVACATAEPRDYEAAVVLAELRTEAGDLDEALSGLEEAGALGGCQNRLDLLSAVARLRRAQRTARAGGDPRHDLMRVLAHRESEPLRVDDPGPWRDVILEAERELTRLG
jgi:tetratricopeptide (TPR) repeat protein